MTAKIARRLAVLALLLSGPIIAADSTRGAFGLAVVRRDGDLIPFAAYDGKRWFARWPLPALDLTVPITVDAVPKGWWGPTAPLVEWQAWTDAGSRMVHVTQPEWVDVHCVRQIALRTDYQSRQFAPPRIVQPYPKDGLAISPAAAIERIDIVLPDAAEARALLPVLADAFNKAERVVEDDSGHPIARRAREGVEPTIEAVYAFGATPRVFYVEASRRYRQLGQAPDECEAVAFGTGWFVRDASGIRPLKVAVDLLGCDRLGASYMLPLGALRLANKTFWVAQFSGWNHERFVALDIKPKSIDVVLNVWGGGCQG